MTFSPRPIKSFAIFLIAACAHIHWAAAQNNPKKEPDSACPAVGAMKAPQLYGLWRVTFTQPPAGLPAHAVMLLEKHAEFSESLAGSLSRDLGVHAGSAKIAGHAAKAFLAGDLENGIFLLDESSDRVSITGTWNGQLVESSCGREIRGVWRDTSSSAPPDAPDVPFTLTRRAAW